MRYFLLSLVLLLSSAFLIFPSEDENENASGMSRGVSALVAEIVKTFNESAKEKYKNNVAVFDFKSVGEEAKKKEIGKTFASYLMTELNKTGEFDIIDRDNIDRAMKEMEMGLSGLVDESGALQLGKIVAANYFLTGTVSQSDTAYIVSIKMTDVETSTVLVAETIEIAKSKLNAMSTLMLTELKYPVVAGFRSAIIPGWGQLYNDRPVKGGLTLFLGIAGAGGAIVFGIMKNMALQDVKYWKALYDGYASWNPEMTETNRLNAMEYYNNMRDSYSSAETFGLVTTASLIGLGAVWLWGVLDGVIDAAIRKAKVKKAQKQLKGHAYLPNEDKIDVALLPRYDFIENEFKLNFVLTFK